MEGPEYIARGLQGIPGGLEPPGSGGSERSNTERKNGYDAGGRPDNAAAGKALVCEETGYERPRRSLGRSFLPRDCDPFQQSRTPGTVGTRGRLSEWFREEAGAQLQVWAEFFGIVWIALQALVQARAVIEQLEALLQHAFALRR